MQTAHMPRVSDAAFLIQGRNRLASVERRLSIIARVEASGALAACKRSASHCPTTQNFKA